MVIAIYRYLESDRRLKGLASTCRRSKLLHSVSALPFVEVWLRHWIAVQMHWLFCNLHSDSHLDL